ncbi:transglycosylase SLT domain-containing protein [Sinorhizobium fredii]|uniref:transglycosylase SLT domain-containing protein n=1 Tax=Rhizobium fredii TaxID=380 RepID=UPI001294F1B9|nr:transglycosylase SLT domain-containing protein [Sinorhizobium fredii]MQW99607.1 transglycosylase SLT domain-containing protein [Sinorhizobium fredii]
MFKRTLLSLSMAAVILFAAQHEADAGKNIIIKQKVIEVERIIFDTAIRYGIDPKAFHRMAWIESRLNPNAFHPKSKACGLFQFIPSTARHYGLVDCFDPRLNAEAAAQLWLDNVKGLTRRLGRAPSAGELYLAHQQGIGGAAALLANPNKQAISILGRKPVVMNGGLRDMTAAQFADLWISKFKDL